ncbi:MAG: TatD family hydrolase [Alphaproteobacteria bacterium]|nr:TatD family hydrolase [Alphaproteobacteria bacterium]
MFIDTHCHLTYDPNSEQVISKAQDVNVGILVCATADPKDIPEAKKLAEQFNNVFITTGIHPDYIDADPTQYLTPDLLSYDKLLGIGEIGLDYHYTPETRDQQIQLFEKQLQIAYEHNLPVAIHTREAEEDTKSILTDAYHGVMHCFTSSWDLAKVMLDRGFYFSASGILTFKNAEEIRETFKKIPIDRIVIETDSPYCAPVPYRGQTCEPYMVIETAKVLASIKNLQLNDLETILEQNTTRLYPKCHVKL